MRQLQVFFRLICSDIKRLKKYILSIYISLAILLSFCTLAGYIISKNIYTEKTYEQIKVGYYLPNDPDKQYTTMAVGLLSDLESFKTTSNLIQVDSVEEGKKLLAKNEILYFIVIPENFFSGIMDGTNPDVEVFIKDNSSISAYISNELFYSYASYLGIAQAGIYSVLDTIIGSDITTEEYYAVQDRVNFIYLDRALNKDVYITSMDATNEGAYTLFQHYIASAIIICMFFTAFVMQKHMLGHSNGMITKLNTLRISHVHMFLSRFICMCLVLYLSFLPCYIAVSIVNTFKPIGLIIVIPGILIIALIISFITSICSNAFSANIVTLGATLILMYIGGGIIPSALLPSAIQGISPYLPGEYLLSIFSGALF